MKRIQIFSILFAFVSAIHIADVQAGSAEPAPAAQKAKNIILMISDGCGYNHINAASLYQYGKTGVQQYEKFPVRLGMSTYTFFGSYDTELARRYFPYADEGATDSAAAATAMGTGVKTYSGAIGVDVNYAPLKNIVEAAEEDGKATGVVTTVQFSHATPAGFVAHNLSRDNYEEIADHMIYGSALEVIMGCGAPDYDNDGNKATGVINDDEFIGSAAFRDMTDDFRVQGGDADGDGTGDEWLVVRTRQAFQELASGETPSRVIGLPLVNETLQQKRSGDEFADPYGVPRIETVPTLAEMSSAAINVLDNTPEGFFLMIEGGAVDWASHDNQSGRMIEEEIDFNRAVEAVVSWIETQSSWEETLLIVTGDHECGWLNGGPVEDLSWTPLADNGPGRVPGMHWHGDEHTNQLIPFFANGPGADSFADLTAGTDPVRGPYIDNTILGKVMIETISDRE